ncbi:MAG TPA: hypothetical protein VL094_06675 [Sphingomonadaceae bacterium]|uniref:hypothetical protein n=1 Tax=Pararhizobium sp. TaxID=1977563 RepID=UPI002C31F540|nr:hypothetical protein [Pararhizobium sp.]HTN14473.1 hypothetical protein [Sphingomonadaceae bacterium]HTO32596.1 hypothetical protein [Pararhizobium sp.]
MTDQAAEVARLRALCPGAELLQDGNSPVVFLPSLKVWSGGVQHTVDALLSPRGHHTYETRLFFSVRLPPGLNWQMYTLLARTWHAVSWRGISAAQPWLDILASHLEVVK